jgi:hypothetical protein
VHASHDGAPFGRKFFEPEAEAKDGKLISLTSYTLSFGCRGRGLARGARDAWEDIRTRETEKRTGAPKSAAQRKIYRMLGYAFGGGFALFGRGLPQSEIK